ncbi:MAG: hypothetical protein WC516_05580 [Patescibacteria group bacterium]|jgi:hypothetical protein
MSFGNNDREYFPAANLPNWLKNFADKELKRGANPFDDIKNIFKQKNDLEAVEAKVTELRQRIGLDKVATTKEKICGGLGDNQPDEKFDSEQLNKGIKIEMEHTNDPQIAKEIVKDHLQETKDFKDQKGAKYYDKLEKLEDASKEELTKSEKVKARLLLGLISISNEYERVGKIKVAELIRQKIQKIAEEEKPSVFKKHDGVKKHIDNVCRSRKGHIDAPALMNIIKSRPEKFSDKELEEIKEYIKKRINEEKEEIDRSRDDDVIGLVEVQMFTVKEDDGNIEVFDKPSKV